jgi:hypothetical protein
MSYRADPHANPSQPVDGRNRPSKGYLGDCRDLASIVFKKASHGGFAMHPFSTNARVHSATQLINLKTLSPHWVDSTYYLNEGGLHVQLV